MNWFLWFLYMISFKSFALKVTFEVNQFHIIQSFPFGYFSSKFFDFDQKWWIFGQTKPLCYFLKWRFFPLFLEIDNFSWIFTKFTKFHEFSRSKFTYKVDFTFFRITGGYIQCDYSNELNQLNSFQLFLQICQFLFFCGKEGTAQKRKTGQSF